MKKVKKIKKKSKLNSVDKAVKPNSVKLSLEEGQSTAVQSGGIRQFQTHDDILSLVEPQIRNDDLELVQLGRSEKALIVPFREHVQVWLHYSAEDGIGGYVLCNEGFEATCALCLIGQERTERHLVPVLDIGRSKMGVLPVSTSLRPQALLPQLAAVLKSAGKQRHVMFVSKIDSTSYSVSTKPLEIEDSEEFATIISEFKHDLDAGLVDFSGLYRRMSNVELAEIPGIASLLRVKGIDPATFLGRQADDDD